MLSSYFDYIFVHLRQKVRLRPKLGLKFCQLWALTQSEKPSLTDNSAPHFKHSSAIAAAAP